MKQQRFGNQGLTVPALALGGMGMPEFHGARDDRVQLTVDDLDELNRAAPVGGPAGARDRESSMAAVNR